MYIMGKCPGCGRPRPLVLFFSLFVSCGELRVSRGHSSSSPWLHSESHKACWVMLSDDWCRKNQRVSESPAWRTQRKEPPCSGWVPLFTFTLKPLNWKNSAGAQNCYETTYLLLQHGSLVKVHETHNWYLTYFKGWVFLTAKGFYFCMFLCCQKFLPETKQTFTSPSFHFFLNTKIKSSIFQMWFHRPE